MEQIKYYSLGSDCVASHVLKKLNLRHKAGPFDNHWVGGIYSTKYILKLLKTDFENYPCTKNFPEAHFIHEDLNTKETKDKYKRRVKRFIEDYKNSRCILVLNINEDHFKNQKDVEIIISNIKEILNTDYFIKNNHILYTWLRNDDNFEKNKELCDMFVKEIHNIENKNLFFKRYCRELKLFGWAGDTNKYEEIFNDLVSIRHNISS